MSETSSFTILLRDDVSAGHSAHLLPLHHFLHHHFPLYFLLHHFLPPLFPASDSAMLPTWQRQPDQCATSFFFSSLVTRGTRPRGPGSWDAPARSETRADPLLGSKPSSQSQTVSRDSRTVAQAHSADIPTLPQSITPQPGPATPGSTLWTHTAFSMYGYGGHSSQLLPALDPPDKLLAFLFEVDHRSWVRLWPSPFSRPC